MHRSFTIILAVLLVVALAIPAFASEKSPENAFAELGYPMVNNKSGFGYYVITDYDGLAYIFEEPPYAEFNGAGYIVYIKPGARYEMFQFVDGSWLEYGIKTNSYGSGKSMGFSTERIVYANCEIYTLDGELIYPDVIGECDGTSCPATDVNHDNICDDCGKVLTMSLRSTLLDFAKARAEFYSDTYPYYAITEHLTNDKYLLVYISKEPMVAGGSNYDTVTGTDMQWATVMENPDGTFGHTTIYPTDSWSYPLVYSNHNIENFLTPPLAVVIQGVTGEALELTLPNLMNQVKTIVLSGVFCLALLISLVLLRRSLKNFGTG